MSLVDSLLGDALKVSQKDRFRALLVDDEPEVCDLMARMLAPELECHSAHDGEEAIRLLSEQHFDICISDYRLPGMNGLGILKWLKEQQSTCPFILVTGFGDKEVVLNALRAGAFDLIEKPFDREFFRFAVFKAGHFIKLAQEVAASRARAMESQQSATVGLLAASIVHEISNPITALTGRIEKIRRLYHHSIVDDHKQDLVEQMLQLVSHITRIVKGVRSLASGPYRPEVISVQDLIKESLLVCGDLIENAGITLTIDSNAPDTLVYCDRVEIAQCLTNLFTNAIHSVVNKSERRIQLLVKIKSNQVVISVVDNGSGVPNELRDLIFQSFFTTKKANQGSGLGLSVSRHLVRKNEGDLTLDISYQGGAKFDLTLLAHMRNP